MDTYTVWHLTGGIEGGLHLTDVTNASRTQLMNINTMQWEDEILEILESAGQAVSKHELSTFFRRPYHKHYRECQDQILRNFLKGLQLNFRD